MHNRVGKEATLVLQGTYRKQEKPRRAEIPCRRELGWLAKEEAGSPAQGPLSHPG